MVDKLIKEIKNDVAYIWINRPDKKNALDFTFALNFTFHRSSPTLYFC